MACYFEVQLYIFSNIEIAGNKPVAHKTFHSYTVRARQGGSQSARDGKSGTNHPKSAGASLRRYNEAAFQQVSLNSVHWTLNKTEKFAAHQ
jgi:Bacteroidetes VLRF1 release factor